MYSRPLAAHAHQLGCTRTLGDYPGYFVTYIVRQSNHFSDSYLVPACCIRRGRELIVMADLHSALVRSAIYHKYIPYANLVYWL